MDVAAVSSAIFVDLSLTAEELEHERFLDAFHAEDGRCNASRQQVVDLGVSGDVTNFVLFLFGDDDFLQRDVLPFQRMDTKENVEHRRVLAAFALRADEQDTVGLDAVAGVQAPGQILLADAEDAFGLDAALHLFGKFLKFNELRVDEMGGLLLKQEPGLPLGSAAAAVDLGALKGFDQFLLVGLIDLHAVAAGHAFEHGRVQPRADPGDLGGDRIDGDHPSDVIGAKLRHCSHLVAWKVDDANERHQVPFTSVQQELAQGLICCTKVVVGVSEDVLRKFVVVALNLTERHLKGTLVRPHLGEVVNGFGILVLKEGGPTSREVEFLNRTHHLHLRAYAIGGNGI